MGIQGNEQEVERAMNKIECYRLGRDWRNKREEIEVDRNTNK